MARAKIRGSRHYVVVLTKGQRAALMGILEPIFQNPGDYSEERVKAASVVYDRLAAAEPWAAVARGLREAVGLATSGEAEVEGQYERVGPAQVWLARVP